MVRTAKLTPRQQAFVAEFLASGNATASAIAAKFSAKGAAVAGNRMLRNAKVQQALASHQKADATRLALRREDVLVGLLDAVDTARSQQNPMAMVAGLRELARMLGFYEPEVKRIELNPNSANALRDLAQLQDHELIALMAGAPA